MCYEMHKGLVTDQKTTAKKYNSCTNQPYAHICMMPTSRVFWLWATRCTRGLWQATQRQPKSTILEHTNHTLLHLHDAHEQSVLIMGYEMYKGLVTDQKAAAKKYGIVDLLAKACDMVVSRCLFPTCMHACACWPCFENVWHGGECPCVHTTCTWCTHYMHVMYTLHARDVHTTCTWCTHYMHVSMHVRVDLLAKACDMVVSRCLFPTCMHSCACWPCFENVWYGGFPHAYTHVSMHIHMWACIYTCEQAFACRPACESVWYGCEYMPISHMHVYMWACMCM